MLGPQTQHKGAVYGDDAKMRPEAKPATTYLLLT